MTQFRPTVHMADYGITSPDLIMSAAILLLIAVMTQHRIGLQGSMI